MNNKIESVLERLAKSEHPIDFAHPTKLTPDLEKYLSYYDFQLENIDYHFGKIEIDETKIMVQMFSPKSRIGTVILLHGYLDHVGLLKNIIEYLNNHHYSVISYDLQGHGLSEGEVASVDDFADYVLTLEKLMNKIKEEVPGPYYGMGHSTGGAILTNYVLKHEDIHFDKVILVAPLIRSHLWYLSKIGYYLLKPYPIFSKLKRNFRENTSDKKFLTFVQKDPLQSKAIPIEWVGSLINWNKEIEHYTPTNRDTLLIQGTADKTVAWRYNLKFLQHKFNRLTGLLVDNGRHQLFNEKPSIRNEVFSNIVLFLKETH